MQIRTVCLSGQELFDALLWVQGAKTLLPDGSVKVHPTAGTTFTLRVNILNEPINARKVSAIVDIEHTDIEGNFVFDIIKDGSGVQYFRVPIKKGMHNLIMRTFNGQNFASSLIIQFEGLPTNTETILNSVIVNIMG